MPADCFFKQCSCNEAFIHFSTKFNGNKVSGVIVAVVAVLLGIMTVFTALVVL